MWNIGLACRRAVSAVALALTLAIGSGSAFGESDALDRVFASVKDDLGLVDARLVDLELDRGRADGNTRVGVVLDGVDLTIEVWEHSVRSDLFRVREEVAKNAWRTLDAGPVRTVRGRVMDIDGARVAGSLGEHGAVLAVEAPDFGRYWIEPVRDGLRQGRDTLHVVYREEDVIGEGAICGVVDEVAPKHEAHEGQDHAHRGGLNCGSQVCVTQIACDADFEFITLLGGSANATQRIEDLMNLVSWQYEPQVGITYEITDILLRTAEPDPYNTTDASSLLSQFRSHWNSNHSSIQRDVAHLFTGKEIDDTTIGIAYVGVICTGSAYGLSQTTYSGSFSCKSSLVAHELGHNWNAPHCDCPGNTMNPSNTCFRIFTNGTRNIIENHRDSRPCLSGGVLPPPGPFSPTVPTDGRGNVGTSPTLQWQESVRATSYHLLIDETPDFASPVVDLMTPDRVVSVSGLHPTRLYYWKVEAMGIGGSTPGDETFCFFTGSLSGRTLYVDRDAPGGGTGLSWASPLGSIQYASEIGRCVGPTRIFEIKVAEGAYVVGPEGIELASGMAMLGGYPGYNTGSPDSRDPDANVTVLSGGGGVARGDAADHVVISNNDDSATLIDGFTIQGGDAQDGLGGGGILMTNSSAVVSNCIIRDCNSADPGGGVRVNGGSPGFVNCLFDGCAATDGAAVYTDSPVSMTNCTIVGNTSSSGGALALDAGGSGSATVVNTAFDSNTPSSIDAPGSLTASVIYSYVPEGHAGTGNRSLPSLPNFVDALGGDYTPGEDSALIDRGDSSAAAGIANDLAGNARDIDATNYSDGSGGTVDIGAYEAPADTEGGGPCEGDANGDNVVDVNDISYVLFRLGGAPPEGDANGDGTIDVNDISYVLFRLGNPC